MGIYCLVEKISSDPLLLFDCLLGVLEGEGFPNGQDSRIVIHCFGLTREPGSVPSLLLNKAGIFLLLSIGPLSCIIN